MADTYEYTAQDTEVWTFDFTNEIIYTAQSESISVQELLDSIREAEESTSGFAYRHIADASGAESLGEAEDGEVAVTVTLLRGWVVQSERTSGTLKVKSGNLVQGTTGDPFGISLGVRYVGLFSSSSTTSTVNVGGSALTTEEHNQLMAILTGTEWRTAIGVESDYTVDGEKLAIKLKAIAAAIKNRMVQSGNDVTFYESDGVTEIFTVRVGTNEKTPV